MPYCRLASGTAAISAGACRESKNLSSGNAIIFVKKSQFSLIRSDFSREGFAQLK